MRSVDRCSLDAEAPVVESESGVGMAKNMWDKTCAPHECPRRYTFRIDLHDDDPPSLLLLLPLLLLSHRVTNQLKNLAISRIWVGWTVVARSGWSG